MTDTEIIIQSLKSVERRIRVNRLLNEITLTLTGLFLIAILLKLWEMLPLLFVVPVTYAFWSLTRKGTLAEAAASIDTKANLNDEIKTAFWFINNPRSSEWVDAQIRRAAEKTRSIHLKRLYPLTVPRGSYAAAAMIVVFLALHFVPPHSNARTQEIPKNSTQAPRVEETLQQIHDSKIDSTPAAALLDQLEKDLSGNQAEKPELQSELPAEALSENAVGSLTDPYSQFREGFGEEEDDPQSMVLPLTKLQVQLEKEKLESTPDETINPEDLEPSKWARSKLSYRAVRTAIAQGEKDLLTKQPIPWVYRPLIKDYFQAIRPPAKK